MHINKFNWLINNGALGVIRAAQLNGRTDQWPGAENRTGARTARIPTGAPTSSTDGGGGSIQGHKFMLGNHEGSLVKPAANFKARISI
jgi:hypothetical protein